MITNKPLLGGGITQLKDRYHDARTVESEVQSAFILKINDKQTQFARPINTKDLKRKSLSAVKVLGTNKTVLSQIDLRYLL